MTLMPIPHPDQDTLGIIEQLRDALKYADAELQRRCVISSKVRAALSAAEDYLGARRADELPSQYQAPPLIPRL